MTHRRTIATALALMLTLSPGLGAAESAKAKPVAGGWQAGVARAVITPEKYMWMSGYGGRSKPADGKVHDLWAKAVAMKDPTGKTAVFVSTDLITVPIKMVNAVMAEITRQHGLGRSEVMFTCSHTHCGPALDEMLSHMLDMKEPDWKQVRSYQKTLDAKLVELGVLPADAQEDIVRAEYESYTRNALLQLRRVREGTQIEQDHMRNRQMIVHWLMANTDAIERRMRGGKTFYVMVDWRTFRAGVAALLGEVQRIKSEGDYDAARTLFETYGIHFDPALRDELVVGAATDRDILPERILGNHHARSVHARLSVEVLERERDVDHVVTPPRIVRPEGLLAEDIQEGEHLVGGDLVGRAVGQGGLDLVIAAQSPEAQDREQ